MKKDTSFKWDDREFIDYYTKSANVIMLERKRCIRILVEIAAFHLRELSDLNILDLGCGDGVITKAVREVLPDNNFFLIDGSEEMLSRAKQNLGAGTVVCRHLTFEEYCTHPAEDAKYHLVFSANAIHHLDIVRKTELFAKIYREVSYGGIFINIDPVHPNSAYSEEIQFALWRNWMNETLEGAGREREIGSYDDIPSVYKKNLENKPSGLWDQMRILEKCGFRDVDCFFKYGIFAVFGGVKK